MDTKAIENRYNTLATDTCCLSCGGAIQYAEAKEGEVCLDLGSGRGTDVLRLSKTVGKNGYVYGIDISEKMVHNAKKTAQKTGAENVEFIRAELDNIPVPNDSVDLIISNCTINHAPNKQKVWNEIFRVLKEGGRFAISDIYAMDAVPEKYRNDPQAVAECWAGAEIKESYINTIIQSGFSGFKIVEESEPYEKGKIEVASFTIIGYKQSVSCCGCK